MARAPVGRQQLIDAARDELVHGNGVFELSGLTRRAGLSTGALYHHFGSKSGLLTAIYDGFYDGLRHAIADAHLPDGDWATRERDRTHRFVAYHLADPLAPILLNRTASDPQLTELGRPTFTTSSTTPPPTSAMDSNSVSSQRIWTPTAPRHA